MSSSSSHQNIIITATPTTTSTTTTAVIIGTNTTIEIEKTISDDEIPRSVVYPNLPADLSTSFKCILEYHISKTCIGNTSIFFYGWSPSHDVDLENMQSAWDKNIDYIQRWIRKCFEVEGGPKTYFRYKSPGSMCFEDEVYARAFLYFTCLKQEVDEERTKERASRLKETELLTICYKYIPLAPFCTTLCDGSQLFEVYIANIDIDDIFEALADYKPCDKKEWDAYYMWKDAFLSFVLSGENIKRARTGKK